MKRLLFLLALVVLTLQAYGQTVNDYQTQPVYCTITASGNANPNGTYHVTATRTGYSSGTEDWGSITLVNGTGTRYIGAAASPAGGATRYYHYAVTVDTAGVSSTTSTFTITFNWTGNGQSGTGSPYTAELVVSHIAKQATFVLNWDNSGCHIPETGTLQINGVTVATASMGSNAVGQTTFTDTDAAAGDSYVWVVDGATIASGTVAFSVEFPLAFSVSDNFSNTCPEPTPTPTPTPSSTPTPTLPPGPTPTPPPATPPPAPSQPPVTSSPPTNHQTGGGGVGEGIVVLNPEDIYGPIVDAINGKDDSGLGPHDIDSSFDTGDQPDAIANDQTSDVADVLGDAQDSYNGATTAGKTKLGQLQPLTMPTGITTKTSWSITLPILGAMVVDISPYQTVITLMRSLLLMVLLIGAWFASVRIIRSGIA